MALVSVLNAANLPREIIDHILSFYFAAAAATTSLHDWVHREIKDEHDIAALCRSWQGPVQRYLLKEVTVRRTPDIISLTRTLASPSEAGQLVRVMSLRLSQRVHNQAGNEPKDLHALLVIFPNLVELRLHLGDDLHKAQYHDFPPLPNLQKLSLDSYKFCDALVSYRQVILKTPHIVSLTLTNGWCRVQDIPNIDWTPIDLPSLTHLSLQSDEFCNYFDKIKLLSDGSLDQITHLEMKSTVSPLASHSPLDLLDKIGRNITTLTLGASVLRGIPIWYEIQYPKQQDAGIIKRCPNLTTLVANRPLVLPSSDFDFPATLARIIVRVQGGSPCWLVNESFGGLPGVSQRISDWMHVKVVEIQGVETSSWLKEKPFIRNDLVRCFAERSVEVILTGVIAPTWIS